MSGLTENDCVIIDIENGAECPMCSNCVSEKKKWACLFPIEIKGH